MKVLVTGGCGFIGQHVVHMLVMRYGRSKVWVLDLRTEVATGWDEVQRLVGDQLLLGNVCEYRDLKHIFNYQKPDVVLHLAAQSHVDKSLEDPASTMRSNAVGTQVVAAICAEHDVPLVYCSTDEVYGDSLEENGTVKCKFESDPLFPSSPYSAGKAGGELAVRAAARSLGLKYAITRGCNAFGEGQYPEKLVPIACRLLQQGRSVPLHGGGEQLRQWIHVSEFAERLIFVAEMLVDEAIENETYNLAGPVLISVRDLVEKIAQVAGFEGEFAVETKDRPGQDKAYSVDGSKIIDDLLINPPMIRIDDPDVLQSLLDHYGASKEIKLASYVESLPREQA